MKNTEKPRSQPYGPQSIIRSRWWLPCLLGLGGFSCAWGDTPINPTIPHPAWRAAQSGAGAAAPAEQETVTGFQLTLTGPTRTFAIIDGVQVKRGDTFNGSRIVAIKPGEILMEDASKSLKLSPDVEKKSITPTQLQSKIPRGTRPDSQHKAWVNKNRDRQ